MNTPAAAGAVGDVGDLANDPANATAPAVGVDVGGTRLKAGLVGPDGTLLATAQRPTPPRSAPAQELEDAVVDVARELVDHPSAQGHEVVGVGVGVAGFVDARHGLVVFAPHLPWRDAPVRNRLAGRLGLPVVLDNDANTAAWAEHRLGAGRGESHLVTITLGTGIGAAVLTDGVLQRGRHGLAGEFGHVQVVPGGRPCECGGRGCWEQYASGSVLRREGAALVASGAPEAAALADLCGGDPDRLEGEHVTRAARGGDRAALAVLTEVGRWLGRGLASVVAALDPGTVVVGGGVSEAGDLLLDPARETLSARLVGRGHRPVPAVVASPLGPSAGLLGAADLVREESAGGGG